MDQIYDIPEYEGRYGVTKSGEIYSFISKKFLSPAIDDQGYKRVNLYKNGIRKTYTVHQLIAKVFLPNPNPSIYTTVNHINFDTGDNRVENLEWASRTENCRMRRNCAPVQCIETGTVFPSIAEAARAFGIHPSVISKNLNNVNGSGGGYHWKYF